MAAAAGARAGLRAGLRLLQPLGRAALGIGLLALAGFLAVALLGFDADDPSWNTAGPGPVRNPAGAAGAVVADLGYQLLGYAVWLLPLSWGSLGLRLILNRPPRWPWLPVVALPLALLALTAALASLAVPAEGGWPYRVGYGGLLGDLQFSRLYPALGAEAYLWLVLPPAALFTVLALAPSPGGALWALGLVGGALLWTVRRGAVALRRARPAGEPELRQDMPSEPLEEEPAPSGEEGEHSTGVVGRAAQRLAAWLHPEGDVAGRPGVAGRRVSDAGEDEETPAVPGKVVPLQPRRRARASEGQAATPDPAFRLPSTELLARARERGGYGMDRQALAEMARRLEGVLDDFGVRGEIVDANPGPVVTRFELEPAPGTRAQRVIGLADDIARSLSVTSVRIATVPGRTVIGIEVPNPRRSTVYLRELLESDAYRQSEARLPLALGKGIAGEPLVVDLTRMPHLLIAGTTGSGKSVAINAMLLSLLYRLPPKACRLILIDPKVIELCIYEDIPHLLAPVVTEPQKAVVALKWVVRQMDERYRLMSQLGVRDIFAFNRRVAEARARGEVLKRRVRVGFEPATGAPIIEEQVIDGRELPLIVVVVDELADLMLTAGKEIEAAIQRLSQKARAAGIHLVVATQRPSVDVITGVIKANLPSRISFRVSSKIDSRTILGEPGAEQLLGHGDMLFYMTGAQRPVRIHGPLVTEAEVQAVVEHLRAQGEPDYLEDVTLDPQTAGDGEAAGAVAGAQGDDLYARAVEVVLRDGKASTSYLQRKLQIGYNNAARLIERMEAEGLVSAPDHVGRRRILRRGGLDGGESEDYVA